MRRLFIFGYQLLFVHALLIFVELVQHFSQTILSLLFKSLLLVHVAVFYDALRGKTHEKECFSETIASMQFILILVVLRRRTHSISQKIK